MSYFYNFIISFMFTSAFVFIFKKLGNYNEYKLKFEIILVIFISSLDLMLFQINIEPLGWGLYYLTLGLGLYKVYSDNSYYFFKIYVITFLIFQISDIVVGYMLHKMAYSCVYLSDTFMGYILYKQIGNYYNCSLYNEFIIQLMIIFLSVIIYVVIDRSNILKHNKSITIEEDNILWIYIVSMLMVFITITYYFQNINTNLDNYLIFFMGLFLSCMLISFIIFFMLNRLYVEKNEKKNVQIYTNMIEEYLENMRTFKHDYNNMLMSLSGFIEIGDMNSLKRYFYEELLNVRYSECENASSLVNIKNIPVKGLISIKTSKAISLGINVVLNVLKPVENFVLKDIDICRILGILIDNAVEASVESDNKILNIGILNDEDEIYIIISNSYKIKPVIHKIFEKGYSTKGEDRGLGLDILKKIKENKYQNLNINTFIKDNMFHQELIIEDK